MSPTVQEMGVALPNLAFSVLMRSIQRPADMPRPPVENRGTVAPTTPLANVQNRLDVSA